MRIIDEKEQTRQMIKAVNLAREVVLKQINAMRKQAREEVERVIKFMPGFETEMYFIAKAQVLDVAAMAIMAMDEKEKTDEQGISDRELDTRSRGEADE